MIYLRKNKKEKYKKIISVSTLIIFLLLIGFFGSFVQNIFNTISNPLLYAKKTSVDSFEGFLDYFASKQNQANKIEELETENKSLKLELLSLNILKNENRELRDLLQLQQENQNFQFAEVLIRPPFSPYDTFVINKNKDSVSIGNKVYYENILIGEIIESYNQNTIVKFYSSSEYTIPVLVNNIEAEAVGQGGYTFLITLPKSNSISRGTPVLTLDNQEIIGVVQGIKESDANTFVDILVSYPINPNEIDIVKIRY